MKTVIIKIASEDEFFRQGRRVAQLADQQKELPVEYIVSFEDPADMRQLLTPARLTLLRAITEHPGSITSIAERLGRAPDLIDRDVDQLEKIRLVTREPQGVRLTAEKLQLDA